MKFLYLRGISPFERMFAGDYLEIVLCVRNHIKVMKMKRSHPLMMKQLKNTTAIDYIIKLITRQLFLDEVHNP